MLSDDEMICSVVGGGCGASNPEDSSAIADDEGKTTGRRSMFLASDDDTSDPDGTSHAAFHKALGSKAAPSIMSSTNLGSAIAYAPQLTPGKKKKKKDEISSSSSEDGERKGADQANAEADSKEPGKEKEE